jgi:hypothetical protein
LRSHLDEGCGSQPFKELVLKGIVVIASFRKLYEAFPERNHRPDEFRLDPCVESIEEEYMDSDVSVYCLRI